MTMTQGGEISRLIFQRGGDVAALVGKSGGAARTARWRLRRAGVCVLPRWRWTATDDKALAQFIRTHDAATPDFWDAAGAVAGMRHPWRAYVRAKELQRSGAPLPKLPPRPKTPSEKQRPPRGGVRVWTDERFAELQSLVTETGCCSLAAEAMGTTVNAVYNILRRRTARAARPGLAGVAGSNARDRDDAAFAEKAWAQFEANQARAK